MGKMSKKNLEDLKRDDPSENNWEIPEEEQGTRIEEQVCDPVQISQPVDPVPEEPVREITPDYNFGGVPLEVLESVAKLEDYAGGSSLLALTQAIITIVQEKVDPTITNNNPVWHWCLADDHCTFVFRNGQKVRVEL